MKERERDSNDRTGRSQVRRSTRITANRMTNRADEPREMIFARAFIHFSRFFGVVAKIMGEIITSVIADVVDDHDVISKQQEKKEVGVGVKSSP